MCDVIVQIKLHRVFVEKTIVLVILMSALKLSMNCNPKFWSRNQQIEDIETVMDYML
jgi:hypothetical protein